MRRQSCQVDQACPGRPLNYDCAFVEPTVSPPEIESVPAAVRADPPPRRGGPLTLLRFTRRHGMLDSRYAGLLLRLVTFEIGRGARVALGRWSWIGHGCKIRAHEGEVVIGAKSVLGQECTISAFQHVSIGRECVVADRVMMIDFDHGIVDVEQPIRQQGIYKRDVRVGHNCWIGYGACVLRGVTIGDNCVVGTSAVVTRDVPANAIVAGIPARVLRMREAPRTLRWN